MPEGFDRLDDRRSARQVMGDAEDAVDQIEFQLLHTGKLAQFVLDQRLLGRAVHGFDAKGAQARAGCRRVAELHHGWRSLAGTAGVTVAGMVVLFDRCQLGAMIVAVVMSMIVLVIMLMLIWGVDGNRSFCRVRKGACCQVKTL